MNDTRAFIMNDGTISFVYKTQYEKISPFDAIKLLRDYRSISSIINYNLHQSDYEMMLHEKTIQSGKRKKIFWDPREWLSKNDVNLITPGFFIPLHPLEITKRIKASFGHALFYLDNIKGILQEVDKETKRKEEVDNWLFFLDNLAAALSIVGGVLAGKLRPTAATNKLINPKQFKNIAIKGSAYTWTPVRKLGIKLIEHELNISLLVWLFGFVIDNLKPSWLKRTATNVLGPFNPSWWVKVGYGYYKGDMDIIMDGTDAVFRRRIIKLMSRLEIQLKDYIEAIQHIKHLAIQFEKYPYLPHPDYRGMVSIPIHPNSVNYKLINHNKYSIL